MREEETEALKIQKERLAAMDEADFMDEWGTGPGAVSEKKGRERLYCAMAHTSNRMKKLISNLWRMLPRIWMILHSSKLGWKHNVTCKGILIVFISIKQNIAKRRKNIPVSEKLRILQNESPELLDLLNEFKEKSETVELLDTLLTRFVDKRDLLDDVMLTFV